MSEARRLLVPLIAVALTVGLGACGGGDNGGGGNGDAMATTPLHDDPASPGQGRRARLEVLLVRRSPETTFGVDAGWGFPSGLGSSGGGEAARRAAAGQAD